MSTPVARKRSWKDSPPKASKQLRKSGFLPVVKDLAVACRKLAGRPVFVRVTHTMADVCDGLIAADQSAAVVLETHEAIWRPILVITEDDILRTFSQGKDCRRQAIGDWMRTEGLKPSRVHSVPASTTIAEAAERLTKYAASSENDASHHLLITRQECDGEAIDESQFVGILSSLDLVRAIAVHMVDEVCSPQHKRKKAPVSPPPFDLNLNMQDYNPSSSLDASRCINLDSGEDDDSPPSVARVLQGSVAVEMDDEDDDLPPSVANATLLHVVNMSAAAERPDAVCVGEVMKPLRALPKCTPKTTMRTAAVELLDSKQSCLFVHDGPVMRGILTAPDFLRAFSEGTRGDQVDVAGWVRGLAQDLHPRHIGKDKSIFDAARQMSDLCVHHLLVFEYAGDSKTFVGVISSLDLAVAIALVRPSRPGRSGNASLLAQLSDSGA